MNYLPRLTTNTPPLEGGENISLKKVDCGFVFPLLFIGGVDACEVGSSRRGG